MWRPGISGRSSFRDDQSQVAYCGAQFCVGGITAGGFTRNTQKALASKNTVRRRARFSRNLRRPPRTQDEECGFEGVAVFLERPNQAPAMSGAPVYLKIESCTLGRL